MSGRPRAERLAVHGKPTPGLNPTIHSEAYGYPTPGSRTLTVAMGWDPSRTPCWPRGWPCPGKLASQPEAAPS